MTVTWTDLSPQQRMLIVHLSLDLPNIGSVGTELRTIRTKLHVVIASLCRFGLVAETRSSHDGVWLRLTSVGRTVRDQGRLY